MMRQFKELTYFKSLPFGNYIINALTHKQFNRLYIPKVFYLEVTNHCNAKCVMCPHEKMKRKLGHMPWNIFTKIVDECAEFEGRGLTFILHKDGEPLMDPFLFQRIDYIKKNLVKSSVQFNTNAMLLNNDNITKILNSPLDSITFSVDGASRETYEHIRKGLKYEIVKNNIANFFEQKKTLGAPIKVTMQMVVGKHNLHETTQYQALWGNKADTVVLKYMHNFLVQKTSIHGSELSERQLKRCLMPFIVMLFFWNGDVGLCCWDYDNMVLLGNIENDSILKIYNNERFKKIREAMMKKSCENISPCNLCSQIYGKDGPP